MYSQNNNRSERATKVRLNVMEKLSGLGLNGDLADAVADFVMELSYDAWQRGRSFGMNRGATVRTSYGAPSAV
jgi:hypothetical protein